MVAGREVTPKDIGDTARLKAYWTVGAGRAKWATSPTPFRTLRAHLLKYLPASYVNQVTADWFHAALGFWPGTPHKGPVPTPGAKRK
ncbi:hypothetical protein [Humibacter ginsenosidimutans]|uniref:Uncharacterized protein n=1 Tax=Humibacter ginsenosidimutans TaxID=2599293 RepID=A0A5B8M669_9MICO|nr:hypothetical protein [Humibacter ginsenosidimutans]QDZ15786.1 hypothetical protein FPZ11_14350 [Humibacter ginsenosidimutans]